MISAADALARVLAGVVPLPPETVPLADADGRVPAAAVLSLRAQPPFAASVMDGYAVGRPEGPWRLAGESAAGHPGPGQLAPAEAARVSTGAAVPAGTWAVVPQEDVALADGNVVLVPPHRVDRGGFIRPAGYDFAKGTVLAEQGQRLTPARLALLAAGGHGSVHVHRRPVVALVLAGDELRPAGAALAPGQIADSNGPLLTALLARAGAVVRTGPVLGDNSDEVRERLLTEDVGADLIVTCGGASVGPHDHLPAAVAALGRLHLHGVAIRPGKPFFYGAIGSARVAGLPGNPGSAYLTTQLFVLPLLGALGGWNGPGPNRVEARLGAPVPASGPRAVYHWATLAAGIVTPLPGTDSGALLMLARANAAIVRQPQAAAAETDQIVNVLRLDSAD